MMKQGFIFLFADTNPRLVADLARDAEVSGWDGFFVWKPIWGTDAWVALAAAAMQTERIRLGTMLSSLPRMRPWKLASEAASLDNPSGGRLILSVGLGALDTGYPEFGEIADRRTRAELLDEGLAILTGLWAGQPFAHDGKHYTIKPSDLITPPPPVQQLRIPIWMPGVWPREKSMARALRFDGLLPHVMDGEGKLQEVTPDAVRQMRARANEVRGNDALFDIVVEGRTDPASTEDGARLAEWEAAGAFWWIEEMGRDTPGSDAASLRAVADRIAAGLSHAT